MSEASSHAAATDERLQRAIEQFETPRAIAFTCLGKSAAQIHRDLLLYAGVVAEQKGYEKEGAYAANRALRYASEAVEWLWQNADGAKLERYR